MSGGIAGFACEDEESKWMGGWLKNGVPDIGWPMQYVRSVKRSS